MNLKRIPSSAGIEENVIFPPLQRSSGAGIFLFMTYSEKLKDIRWFERSRQIRNRDGNKCWYCGESNEELNVHHKIYIKGLEPWEYEDEYLVTLCNTCHEGWHQQIKVIKEMIDKLLLIYLPGDLMWLFKDMQICVDPENSFSAIKEMRKVLRGDNPKFIGDEVKKIING